MRKKIICDGRYVVTSDGDVYSLFYKNRSICKKRKTPLKLKQFISNGYGRVQLAERKQYSVHRLVAKAFINGFNEENQVNHIDGDKLNNKLENLEISNNSHNQIHSYHVLGNRSLRKLTENDIEKIVDLWASGTGTTKISKITGICYTVIYNHLRNILLRPNSVLNKKYYDKVLVGFAKSKHSKHRHHAKEALNTLKSKLGRGDK